MTNEKGTTNKTDVEVLSGNTESTNALDILKGLDDKASKTLPVHCGEGFFIHTDPNDAACGKWGREQMNVLKSAALSSKTVYAYCFVQSSALGFSAIAGWCLVAISVVIQIVIPLGIVILLQPVQNIDGAETTGEKLCPNRSDGFTKFLAFCLSAFFIVLTLGLCTNKLRGLLFLKNFVDLGKMRGMCISFGIFSQMVGIMIASACQYLLFIGNGNKYVVLLLQSLAMQFCLTVDEKIVSHQIGAWTAKRLQKITANGCLATKHGGLGDEDGPMPAKTLECIQSMVNSEKLVLVMFVTIGVFFSVGLAVCM